MTIRNNQNLPPDSCLEPKLPAQKDWVLFSHLIVTAANIAGVFATMLRRSVIHLSEIQRWTQK